MKRQMRGEEGRGLNSEALEQSNRAEKWRVVDLAHKR